MQSEAEGKRDDILSRFADQIEQSNRARTEAAKDLANAEGKTYAVVSNFSETEKLHFETLCGRLDTVQAAVANQNVLLAEIEKEQKQLRELYQSESERSNRALRDRLQRAEDLIQVVGAETAKTRQANETLTTALQSLIEQIRLMGGERG